MRKMTPLALCLSDYKVSQLVCSGFQQSFVLSTKVAVNIPVIRFTERSQVIAS